MKGEYKWYVLALALGLFITWVSTSLVQEMMFGIAAGGLMVLVVILVLSYALGMDINFIWH